MTWPETLVLYQGLDGDEYCLLQLIHRHHQLVLRADDRTDVVAEESASIPKISLLNLQRIEGARSLRVGDALLDNLVA